MINERHIPMKSIDILILGPPKSGKTTLARALSTPNIPPNPPDSLDSPDLESTQKLGLSLFSYVHTLPSGEPLKLTFWDIAEPK